MSERTRRRPSAAPKTEETPRRRRPVREVEPDLHVERRESGKVVDEKKRTPRQVQEADRDRVDAFARVRVGGSVTQNMGDFNSVRVSVEVELPCKPTTMDIEETYGLLSEKVDEFLERELELATTDDGYFLDE